MMHIFSPKNETKNKAIEVLPPPSKLFLPLGAHRGKPAIPLVKIGERVKKFQCIAQADGHFSINLYAPVSGVISNIESLILPNGKSSLFIVIDNDFKDDSLTLYEDLKLSENSTRQELVNFILKAGIVGQGGAQFPTHIKYDIGKYKLDTLIINAAECEPYLTADYSLLTEKYAELIEILELLHAILKPNKIVLAVEKQNQMVLKYFQIYEKNNQIGFYTHILPNEYPQGSELQLIKSVTKKTLRKGVLPIHEGILVSNIGTLIAMATAQKTSYPIISRVLTVNGDKIPTKGNYEILLGSSVQHILSSLKLEEIAMQKTVLIGGPMMGDAIHNLEVPINSGSAAILLLNQKRVPQYNCIACGYCVEVCPMNLMPYEFAFAYEKQDKTSMQTFNLSACIECGACQYICPSDVSLIESIKRGKIDFLKI